jgi:hypothetical protein
VLDRTFAAVVCDWDGTLVPDRHAKVVALRRAVESLCRFGVEVVIVSGTHVGNVDPQLGARPEGPGELHLCLNRGSEVFRVGREGPELVWRRQARPDEEAALDRAAAATVQRLARNGLAARVVSQRLNRRKIDLVPDDPRWADPPKARIGELLEAVEKRLHDHGLDLASVVAVAEEEASGAGVVSARVTSDAKHVEIGLTDKSQAATWADGHLADLGIGPGLVLVGGDEFGDLGGLPGSDALLVPAGWQRSAVVSVGVEPGGVPAGVLHLGGGPRQFLRVLQDQVVRHRAHRVPAVDEDPAWVVRIGPSEPQRSRADESVLTLADGVLGTRGALEEDGPGSTTGVYCAGLYTGIGSGQHLVECPVWTNLPMSAPARHDERVLDLRTGVLVRHRTGTDDATYRSARCSFLEHLKEPRWPAAKMQHPGGHPGGLDADGHDRGTVPARGDQQRVAAREPAEVPELVAADQHQARPDAQAGKVAVGPGRRLRLVRQADLDVLRVARHAGVSDTGGTRLALRDGDHRCQVQAVVVQALLHGLEQLTDAGLRGIGPPWVVRHQVDLAPVESLGHDTGGKPAVSQPLDGRGRGPVERRLLVGAGLPSPDQLRSAVTDPEHLRTAVQAQVQLPGPHGSGPELGIDVADVRPADDHDLDAEAAQGLHGAAQGDDLRAPVRHERAVPVAHDGGERAVQRGSLRPAVRNGLSGRPRPGCRVGRPRRPRRLTPGEGHTTRLCLRR